MATATITGPEQVEEGRVEDRGAFTTRSPEEASRRRFTIAVVTGTALTVPFMLWLLWDLWWGKVNVIRGVSFDYFYDRQARAMFHGHLWIPPGQLSIEAFLHAGGEKLHACACLNEHPAWIEALRTIVLEEGRGWMG